QRVALGLAEVARGIARGVAPGRRERLDPRPVSRRAARLPAATPGGGRDLGQRGQRLVHEAGLADPRLTGDQDELAARQARARAEERDEQRELALASDEGDRMRERRDG